MAAVKKGMGFKAAQSNIAKKQGIPMERAGAILASATRKASPAAKNCLLYTSPSPRDQA